MWSKNELKQLANGQVQEQVSSGQLQNVKVFENIVDKDGHKRFIEDDGVAFEIEGVTPLYNKWSLSGTHLIVVYACSIASGTAINGGSGLAKFELPAWIRDKIVGVQGSLIEYKSFEGVDDTYSKQTFNTYLGKVSGYGLRIVNNSSITLSSDKSVRFVFDLLIDNE